MKVFGIPDEQNDLSVTNSTATKDVQNADEKNYFIKHTCRRRIRASAAIGDHNVQCRAAISNAPMLSQNRYASQLPTKKRSSDFTQHGSCPTLQEY